MAMNFMNLMKQVQNVQAKAMAAKGELEALEIIGESTGGYVQVLYDGQGKFKSIKISPEAINPENPSSVDSETVEMLEDLITSAINEATEKAAKEMSDRMKKITGGVNIPGLSF